MSAAQIAPNISNDPYAELERRFARLSAVNRASAILSWDRSTMMPDGASEDRADQLATLNVIAHETITAPDMPELLARALRAQKEQASKLPGNGSGGGDDECFRHVVFPESDSMRAILALTPTHPHRQNRRF